MEALRVEPRSLPERRPQDRVSRARHPERPCQRREDAGEAPRRHADDGEGLSVEDDRAADGIRGSAKAPRPERMRQHHGRRRAGQVVRRPEQPAGGRLDADDLEIVAADHLAEYMFVLGIDPESERLHLEGGEPRERGIAVAQLDVRSIACVRKAIRVDPHHRFRVRDRERPQEERIRHAEDRGIHPDAQRQHRTRNRREPGRPAQRPTPIAHVLQKAAHAL